MDALTEIKQTFDPKFEELTATAKSLGDQFDAAVKANGPDSDQAKALREEIQGLDSQVKELTRERDDKLRDAEMKAMQSHLEELTDFLKQPAEGKFSFGSAPDSDTQKALFGPGTDTPSFFAEASKALNGDTEALNKWAEAMPGKAMTEGTGTAGGYLVPDQISTELLELREQVSVLRPLFSRLQVVSDTLRIPSITSGLTAGWVAELATKPSADLAFAEMSVNVFTKAGLAVASNQLLRDARQSVDRLIYKDLAKRLAWLEEVAFLAGTGTGQPLGILNTSGVNAVPLTSTAVLDLLDAIVDAITAIFTNFFEGPNAIIMHPRTWARIVKARESSTSATFLVGPPSGGADARRPTDSLPGYRGAPPRGELFGYPVYTTSAMPTNLGAGTNQSAVVVGKMDEGLILDRQGIELAASEHVYFTSNQTVFRAEDRMGFTAARYPKAFSVISGTGLASG